MAPRPPSNAPSSAIVSGLRSAMRASVPLPKEAWPACPFFQAARAAAGCLAAVSEKRSRTFANCSDGRRSSTTRASFAPGNASAGFDARAKTSAANPAATCETLGLDRDFAPNKNLSVGWIIGLEPIRFLCYFAAALGRFRWRESPEDRLKPARPTVWSMHEVPTRVSLRTYSIAPASPARRPLA